MNAIDVLAMLRDRGIAVWVEPDGMHMRPASALTPELRNTVRGHKDAIIQQLVADRRDDLADDSAWWRDQRLRAYGLNTGEG